MPVYTFKCPTCGHTAQVVLSITRRDQEPQVCRQPHHFDYYESGDGSNLGGSTRRMERVPTSANFSVRGYSAKNGYAK